MQRPIDESNKPRDNDNQAQAEVAEGDVTKQQGAPLQSPSISGHGPNPLGSCREVQGGERKKNLPRSSRQCRDPDAYL